LRSLELVAQDALAADLVDELVFCSGQLDIGGYVVDAHLRRLLNDVGHGRVRVDQQVVDRLVDLGRRLHVKGEVALGVEIDQKHPLAKLRQSGSEVDCGGGLADTPLLHGDGYRSGQDWPESNGSWENLPVY
jgi:hypothetical protein